MFTAFVLMKRRHAREWILGALLMALAGTALAGDPVNGAHRKKPPHADAPPQQTAVTPIIPAQHRYLSPFEMEYASYLGKSSAAVPGDPPSDTAPRSVAPIGPLKQAEQVDSYGLLPNSPRPQTPSVAIGDWNFSAAAHLPSITHEHDTGAAISAAHGF